MNSPYFLRALALQQARQLETPITVRPDSPWVWRFIYVVAGFGVLVAICATGQGYW